MQKFLARKISLWIQYFLLSDMNKATSREKGMTADMLAYGRQTYKYIHDQASFEETAVVNGFFSPLKMLVTRGMRARVLTVIHLQGPQCLAVHLVRLHIDIPINTSSLNGKKDTKIQTSLVLDERLNE